MKWLRSSLFRNNSDSIDFEEKVNINIEHYDSALKEVKDVVVSGTLTRGGSDKIYVDLRVNGIFKMISGKTLKDVEIPFEIIEKEEYLDKSLVTEDDYEVNVMDMYIDLLPLVKELIILNIPITSSLEDEEVELVSGKDWELTSEDEISVKEEKTSPFAALNGLFNEK